MISNEKLQGNIMLGKVLAILMVTALLALSASSCAQEYNSVDNYLPNVICNANTMGNPPGWSDDLRLSYITNPNASTYLRNYSTSPRIAVSGNVIHAVWETNEVDQWNILENSNVTYSRSIDNGRTWSTPIFLSNMTGGNLTCPKNILCPKIAVSGNYVYVVWMEITDFYHLRFRRSLDNGQTWEQTSYVYLNPIPSGMNPDIAAWEDSIHVVWQQTVAGGDAIYYSNSTDNGLSWSSPRRITLDDDSGTMPCIEVNTTNIHLVFHRWYFGGLRYAYETFYLRSNDSGATWSNPTLLTPADGLDSAYSDMKVNGNKIHIIIEDARDLMPRPGGVAYQLYYFNSSDGGITWSPEQRLTYSSNDAMGSSIDIQGNTINIVWANYTFDVDDTGGPADIYYINSTDGGITWSENYKLTFALGNSNTPDVAFSGNGNINIVFQDNREFPNASHSTEIYYKRFPDFPPDAPPIANAGPDQSVNEDDIVQFDGSNSTDDVGILWYNWSFGDGCQDFGTNITSNHIYTNAGTYIVTLNISDAAGNWDTDTCLVFVNNIAPIANADGDKMGNEGQPITFDGSASWDTPSDYASLIYIWYFGDGNTMAGKVVTHAYGDNGIYNVTLVVTDHNGYSNSDTITVTVNNLAPTIESVSDQIAQQAVPFTLKINAIDVPADILTFSDNTTLFDINPVTGIIQFTPTNDDVGVHFVKVMVADDDGGSSSVIIKITVLNTNDPPLIQPIPSQAATQDILFTLQVNATDPDGDTLTYSLTAYPAGMTINPSMGLISWTPTNSAVGSHVITVRVRDVGGLYDEGTFTITVANVNDPPSIITVSLPNATEDMVYLFTIQATDIDADQTLTYSLDQAPAFLSISPSSGLLYGTPANDDVGTHSIVVNVTDGIAYTKRTLQLTVINVNDPPTIDYIPPQTATEDSAYSLQVIGHDIDAGDTVTYSLIVNPTGMTIGSSTGLISWVPGNDDVGTHTVVVKVADIAGLYDTKTFIIVVANVNDAPIITTTSLPNATQDSPYFYGIQASDVDIGDTLTFSLDSAPTFLSIIPSNGLLYSTPTNAHVGIHQVIVNVTDGTVYVTKAFNLTVLNVNDPPTLGYVPPQAAIEEVQFSLQLVGHDVDVGDVLYYWLILAPDGMTVNQANGLITWTPTNDDVGTHTIIARATDASGAFAERSFLITVANVNNAPTISTTSLPDATEGSMYFAAIQADDIDGDVLKFSLDSAPSFLSIDARTGLIYGIPTESDVGIHQIILNISDGTAFVTKIFNLIVLNVNDLPIITSYPITVAKLGAGYVYTIIAEDADVGDELAFSLIEAPEGMVINSQNGSITWTPTDAQAGQTYRVVVQVSDGYGSTTQTFAIAVQDLPPKPYHPWLDDYIWVGIVLFLVTMVVLLTIALRRKDEE